MGALLVSLMGHLVLTYFVTFVFPNKPDPQMPQLLFMGAFLSPEDVSASKVFTQKAGIESSTEQLFLPTQLGKTNTPDPLTKPGYTAPSAKKALKNLFPEENLHQPDPAHPILKDLENPPAYLPLRGPGTSQ